MNRTTHQSYSFLVLLLKFLILPAILFYSLNSLAYAPTEGNITSYFGPYLYKTNFRGSDSGAASPVLAGIGLVVNGDVNEKGSLEISLFLMEKNYFREETGKYIETQTTLAHFTMGYRRWFSEKFSGSLCFASGYSVGSPRLIHSDFPVGSEIDTSAKDTVEYGFELALQSEIMKRPTYTILVEARYLMSVTNKANENADHFGLMLGFRYAVQERNPAPKLQ